MLRRSPVLIALVLLVALAGCGGDDSDDGGGGGGDSAGERTTASAGGCEQVEAPSPRKDGGRQSPDERLDPQVTHDVEIATNCGGFTIRLDVEGAPKTTASFAALAESGFYDNTTFHRIVPDFVIQGGDPTGTGSGGPGYKTVDRPPPSARYTRGVVAMAKTATEAPGTAGSQFYVVTAADAGLPPEYAIVGEVVEGMDVVERIGRLGEPATEQPTEPVVIESATVESS